MNEQPDDFNPEVDTPETYNATPSDDVRAYCPRCEDCGTTEDVIHGPCPPARFTFASVRDNFAGAVMPLRDDDDGRDDRLPAWIGTI